MELKFFESQASDPKPSRIGRMRNYDNNLESSEMGSDSNEEYREYDLEDSDADTHDNNNNLNSNINNININNSINHNKNDYLSKVELDEDDEDQDEDNEEEEDDDEYEEFNNFYDHLENNSSKRIKQINSNKFSVNGLTRSKKRVNKEAGLWWDEDMALNELTSSMSFDFDSQYHMQSPIGGGGGGGVINEFSNKNSFFTRKLQEHDEVVTLKTLESMHSKNNESNKNSKENVISSSSTTSIISASKTGENLIRRLSLT